VGCIALYGELLPGMAYLIRRLVETILLVNSSFPRQSMEDRPVEELLAPPFSKKVCIGNNPSSFILIIHPSPTQIIRTMQIWKKESDRNKHL